MYKNLLILPDGRELFSGTGEKNAIKSVKLTELVNSGNDLTIGSVCSNMIEVTLYTDGIDVDLTSGDALTLFKVDDAGIRTKIGIFSIELPTRPTPNTMKLCGYDNVTKLDKDLTAWLSGLGAWPYTLRTFAANVCNACGLVMNDKDIPNADMDVQEFTWTGVTGRKLMQWAGEAASRFVRADPDGNIEFGWYEDSGITLDTVGADYYFSGTLTYENYTVSHIEGTQIRRTAEDGNPLFPEVPEGMNTYIIRENPLIANTYKPLTVLENITHELSRVSYTPSRVSLPARLDLRAGSIVRAIDRLGRAITIYVMEKTNSGQKDTIECRGNVRRDSSSSVNAKTEEEKQEDKLLNYVVNSLRSVLKNDNGESVLQLNGASIVFSFDLSETLRIANNFDGLPIIYMHDVAPESTQHSAEYSPHHIKLGGTSTQPVMEFNAQTGVPRLDIGGGYKKLSWKDNGDGTYTLIGS